jgi:hypothetical protein
MRPGTSVAWIAGLGVIGVAVPAAAEEVAVSDSTDEQSPPARERALLAFGVDGAALLPLPGSWEVVAPSAAVDLHVGWKRARPPLGLGLEAGALYSPLIHDGRDDGHFETQLLILDVRPRIELDGGWWRVELGLGAGIATERSTWHPTEGAATATTTIAQSASVGLGGLLAIADDLGLAARLRYTHLFDGDAADTLGLSLGLELRL